MEHLDYLRRARAYRLLDRQLHAKTRFFAAASVVCEVLGTLSSSPARFAVSAAARQGLASLSTELEPLNLRIAGHLDGSADRLERGRREQNAFSRPALDAHIVRIEQIHVQRHLDRLRERCRAHSERLLADCNRLLNCPGLLPRSEPGAAALLRRVLVELRGSGARTLDFGEQRDREDIGLAIIARVRAERPATPG
jgi:hypothetical protein